MATQQPDQTPPREQLLAARDDLIRRANQAYQDGQHDTALQLLEQLFPLYEQLYPAAEYPNGGVEVARTYQRMCGIAKAKGDISRLISFAQKGLAACDPSIPCCETSDHIETAAVLRSYCGVAYFELNDLNNANQEFLLAAELHRRAVKHSNSRVSRILIPDVYESLAQISVNLSDLSNAQIHLGHALDSLQSLPQEMHTLEIVRRIATCYYAVGSVARRRGNCVDALRSANAAEDYAIQLFLVTRSEQDYDLLIRALSLAAILYKDMGEEDAARQMFESVHRKLSSVSNTNKSLSCQLDVAVCNLLQICLAQHDESAAGDYRRVLTNRLESTQYSSVDSTDAIGLAELKRNLGVAFFQMGDNATAEQILRDSLAILAKSKDASERSAAGVQEVVIRNDLGRLYSASGRYNDAGAQYWAALKLAESQFCEQSFPRGHPLLVTLLQNFASHCWLIGETDAAIQAFGRMFDMCQEVYSIQQYPNGHPRLLQAYSAWCSVLVRENRISDAERYAEQVNRLMVKWTKARWSQSMADDLAASWVDLGRIRRARGDFSAAREFFGRALESYGERRAGQDPDEQLSIALVLADIGRTCAEERDFDAALSYLRQSLDMRRRLFPAAEYPAGHPSLANALRDTGMTCLLAGEHRQAFELLSEAARIEHAIGESFFGGASEAQLLNLAARKFQSLGPLLQAWEHTGLPTEAAYAYVWNRHGFVPRLIAQRQRLLRQWARRDGAARYKEYVHARQNLARALLVSITDDLQGQATRLTQLEQLNHDKEALEQELTDTLELPDGSDEASQAVQALSRALPDGAAFVDFYAFASRPFDATLPSRAGHGEVDRMVAFVVTRDRPVAFVDLGDPRPLAALVDSWHEEIERDAEPVAGVALREKIWDPIAAALPPHIQTVYIAPDGPVSNVPWSALPCPGEIGVLLEHYAIATVPHGSFLLDQLTSPSSPPASWTTMLVVADVDYGDQDADIGQPQHGLKQLRWPRLGASRRELEAIANSLGDREITALTGCDASTTAVAEALGRVRLAHFATHGFFLDDPLTDALRLAANEHSTSQLQINSSRASFLARSPFLRSGLALAGANRPAALGADGLPRMAEGILTAEAVASLDAEQLDLVVLSACDTTRGDLATGDGVLGIQNAFHIGGARNVISGLWKIPDEAAADLMTEFYRLLAHGSVSPLAALRLAQLQLARQAGLTTGQTRGAELASTVPLPATVAGRVAQWCPGVKRWAGFSLSGPGY